MLTYHGNLHAVTFDLTASGLTRRHTRRDESNAHVDALPDSASLPDWPALQPEL